MDKELKLIPEKLDSGAVFDARVFSMPEEDVSNYFYWRWKDASRNSVSMAARNHFSHKKLHGKSVAEMKDMLRYEANKPWEDMPSFFKDGWLIQNKLQFAWNPSSGRRFGLLPNTDDSFNRS